MGKPDGNQQAGDAKPSWNAKKQHGGPKQQGGFHHGSAAATTTTKPGKAQAPVAPPRKYVVVIRNVENDFSRVHASALERYFRLNRSLEKSRVGKDAAATPFASDVTFEIKARTETRSAELRVFAPSTSSDISAAWTPSNNYNASATTATEADGGDGAQEGGFSVGAAGGRFSSLEDMVSVLKQKPYLVYPPTFMTSGASTEDAATSTEDASSSSSAIRQADFVTVELVTSSYTSNKNLKKVLSDVPGFVTSWPLYAMHFRGIFANESSLFRSKSLLDQFEAEGLRINLVLPDVVARKYEAYLTHQADE